MRSRVAIAMLVLAAWAAGVPAPVAPAAAAGLERLMAPASACPRQSEPSAASGVQVRAMRCLTNFARRAEGLPALGASPTLNRAAGHKSADILRCQDFSHEACGREFTHWIERSGYRACSSGENIAWGSGRLGSAGSTFRRWIQSPGHRENILGPFEEIGIGLRSGRLDGAAGAHVWTQHFGARC